MANSFTLNGVDYGGANYGVIVTDVEEETPELKVHVAELSGANGAVTQGEYVGARYLTLRCLVVANYALINPDPGEGEPLVEDLTDARLLQQANIETALRNAHTAGETTFYLDRDSTDTKTVRPINLPRYKIRSPHAAEFELRVIQPNPDS